MEKRIRSGYDANKNHQQIIKILSYHISRSKKNQTEIFYFFIFAVGSYKYNYQTVLASNEIMRVKLKKKEDRKLSGAAKALFPKENRKKS